MSNEEITELKQLLVMNNIKEASQLASRRKQVEYKPGEFNDVSLPLHHRVLAALARKGIINLEYRPNMLTKLAKQLGEPLRPDTYYIDITAEFDQSLSKLRAKYPRSDISADNQDERVWAKIVLKHTKVYLQTPKQDYLVSKLRPDMQPHKILSYIFNSHPNEVVKVETIRNLDGCAAVSNLSEVFRGAGFNEELKSIFLLESTASRVMLKPEAELTRSDLNALIKSLTD